MLVDPEMTWGDVQEDIEYIAKYQLEDDGTYLGLTPEEILKKNPEESVYDIMSKEDALKFLDENEDEE